MTVTANGRDLWPEGLTVTYHENLDAIEIRGPHGGGFINRAEGGWVANVAPEHVHAEFEDAVREHLRYYAGAHARTAARDLAIVRAVHQLAAGPIPALPAEARP